MGPVVAVESELLPILDIAVRRLGLSVVPRSIAQRFPEFSYQSIAVSRTTLNQIVTYPVVAHSNYRGRLATTPAKLTELEQKELQHQAIEAIGKRNLLGSYLIRFNSTGNLLEVLEGVTSEGLWSQEFSATSIFENAVRATFDLPLGNSEMTQLDWALINFSAPPKLDMKQPFLHLFAHDPNYRIQKFSSHTGYVAITGKSDLWAKATHAVDYLEGVIEE